jgi:glycosyltransferase involved in cell wall biosynthesis
MGVLRLPAGCGSRPMRVVIVTGIWPPDIGGPATHAAVLAEELSTRGHAVTVVTLGEDDVARREPGVVRYPRRWSWPARMAAVTAWLIRNRSRYDVVYALGLHPAAVAGARLGGRPVVARVVADPVWERGSRLGLTDVGFERFQSSRGGGVRVRAMRKVRDWSLRRSTAITVPTEELAQHVRTWGGVTTPVVVIPNAARAPGDRTVAPTRDRLRAISCGRLVPLKRVDAAIDALAMVREMELEVVGDGPERAVLERRAQSAGVADRVTFFGAIAHEAALERIADADVLVIPSSYDTSPHVVLEALVCGTPVVGSGAGGLPDLIHDGVSGILVDPLTAEGLAGALARLQSDPSLRARLAGGALDAGNERRFGGVADSIERVLLRSIGRPRGVVVGRAPIRVPLEPGVAKRFAILARHLDATVLAMGDGGVRRTGGVRLILFPNLRPRALAGLLYYSVTAPLSLFLARRRGAVICQSPHAAFGPILVGRLLPKRIRPRVLVELHGDWRASSRLYGGRGRHLMAPVADALAAWSVRRAARVRTVGSHTTALARAAGYTGEIDTFVTFSDLEPFVDQPQVQRPDDLVVAYAGAFEKTKGVDVLLDAWAKVTKEVPHATLELAGEGPLRSHLESRARSAGLNGSVRFLGHVSTAELVRLLDRSVCVVLPSRSEGTPRIILEAMARARAVVASRVGAIPDLVDDGRSGLLVPADDAAALAGALVAVTKDGDLSARMGRAGLERFRERDPASEFEMGIARTALWIGRHA